MHYAILFSGMTERRHLNGLEFGYRVLVEQLDFRAANVQVLTYDGGLRTTDEGPDEDTERALWPGDGTPYRVKVAGQGSRQAFRQLLLALGARLTGNDLVFINITGHGGNYGDGRGPYLLTYPRGARYWVHELCSDLRLLPRHQSLVVLLAQCFSAGFNEAILKSSPADQTYVASASDRHSHAMEDHLHWDSFQRNWLAGLAQRDVSGTPLPPSPAIANRGSITVAEAFKYATSTPLRHVRDQPKFAAQPEAAASITLAQDIATGAAVTAREP